MSSGDIDRVEDLVNYFVTGASGWIGSAVIAELIAAGHHVVGLARSDDAAERVADLDADVRRGQLDDVANLAAAAADSDGVVHLGYIHDFSDMAGAARTDATAIEAMGAALAGSDRPLLIASGTLGLRDDGGVGAEDDRPDPAAHPRVANAVTALALADRGVRSMVVRFAPTVHGPGDHGFVSTLADVARTRGFSAYVGDGSNRWPAVHRLDAAHLVRLGVEDAAAGTVWHATAEEGVASRTIAEALGRSLDVPVRSIPADEAESHFGWLGFFFAADAPASSATTRRDLGWTPTHPTLIEDIDAGCYAR